MTIRLYGQARLKRTAKPAALTVSPVLAATLILALLFLGTALVGVWAAYDRPVAWRHFGSIAGGVAVATLIAWAGRRWGTQALGWIALGCALLAVLISLYFFLTNDWTLVKYYRFPLQQQAGLWLQAHRPAIAGISPLNPNTIAGGLLVTLPLGLGGLLWAWAGGTRRAALAAGAALLVSFLALLLTISRAAWLLFCVALLVSAYLEWRHLPDRPPDYRRLGDGLLWIGLLLVILGFGAALFWPDLEFSLEPLPRGQTLTSRINIWRNALTLIGDYPITGSGLGSTVMVYSSYVLLLHVGFIDEHVHNLLLQVAVEQGLPGLIVFLALLGLVIRQLVRWYRRAPGLDLLRAGAAAALIGLLLQGLGEAGNYNSPLVLIGFLPFGFIMGGSRPPRPRVDSSRTDWWLPAVAGALILVCLTPLLLPGGRAAFQANLGAVAQTRAELAVYCWPEWPVQDAVRCSDRVDLKPAIDHYRAALALDPLNVTANRRLGQIELSLGEYDLAYRHLEAAFIMASHQRANQLLLAEIYALNGRVDWAVTLWECAGVTRQEVEIRQRWYRQVGDRQQRANLAAAAGEVRCR